MRRSDCFQQRFQYKTLQAYSEPAQLISFDDVFERRICESLGLLIEALHSLLFSLAILYDISACLSDAPGAISKKLTRLQHRSVIGCVHTRASRELS